MKSRMAGIVIVISVCVVLAAGIATVYYWTADETVRIQGQWSALNSGEDQWNWVNGKIVAHSTNGESILASSREYRNVTLSAIVGTTNREASLAVRMQDADNGYLVIFAPLGDNVLTGNTSYGRGMVRFHKKTSGKEVVVNAYAGQLFSSITSTAKLAVSAKGPWFEVLVNDVTVLRIKDTDFSSGLVGLRICGDEKYPCDAAFSDVTISEARS